MVYATILKRSIHARHLLFYLKQETGRELPPSAPLALR